MHELFHFFGLCPDHLAHFDLKDLALICPSLPLVWMWLKSYWRRVPESSD